MAEHEAPQSLDPPRVYLVHMVVFTMLVAVLVAVILPGLQKAFLANPVLNGVIIATLLLGMLHSYRMVGRLFREVNWVNRFRHAEKGGDTGRPPQLLAPMATLMKNRQNTVLSPISMRSLLDSLASRLDESRDMSRYLVGLLIFLGLLGTFWGLLETVSSIGGAIDGLDVSSAQSATIVRPVEAGPASAAQGHGPVVLVLVVWSRRIADPRLPRPQGGASAEPFLYRSRRLAVDDDRHRRRRRRATAATEPAAAATTCSRSYCAMMCRRCSGPSRSFRLTWRMPSHQRVVALTPGGTESIEQLADAVASLVTQMREEQKMVRQWAQGQQTQQNEIQRLLMRATGPLARGASRARAEDDR